MQIIELKHRRFITIFYLISGVILVIIGIRFLVISSFDLSDFKKIKGTIAHIDIKDFNGFDNSEQKQLIIKIKEDSGNFCSEKAGLINNLKVNDSIEIFVKSSNIQNSYDVYGLIYKNQILIDYKESVRIKIWGGLIFLVLGLFVIIYSLISYKRIKGKESVWIDKDTYFPMI